MRAIRFFSAASRLGSRFGEPSPTRTTPGRPTARCTTSIFRFAETAGVTVQLPRIDCMMAAAAPGCPAIAAYWADWANLPNKSIPTDTPTRTPSGMMSRPVPVSRPAMTNAAMIRIALPITIGRAFGFCLRTIPATKPICLIRPGVPAPGAAFFAAGADLFTMHVRIRAGRGYRETRPVRAAPGPVGRAHQPPGQHASKTDLQCLFAQLVELGGRDPALDRVVADRRPEVLRDRQQVAGRNLRVGHGLADLRALLAHAEDEVRLDDQPGAAGPADHLERALVAEAGPDPAENPRHGLDVVREYLGAGRKDLGQLPRIGVEIGDQQLHAAAGDFLVDLPASLRVQPGASVVEVIAGHPGDRRIPQAHRLNRLGDPAR